MGPRGRQGTLGDSQAGPGTGLVPAAPDLICLLSGPCLGDAGGCKHCQDPGHMSCSLPRVFQGRGTQDSSVGGRLPPKGVWDVPSPGVTWGR